MNRKRPTRSTQQSENVPTDPEVALNKLTTLLDKIPLLLSQNADSPGFKTWERDAKIAMRNFYGASSEEYSRFNRIDFTPRQYYHGQPNSEFVDAFNQGMEEARLFLISRKDDWNVSTSSTVTQAVGLPKSSKLVFVVHGHNHGIKETVARFLTKLGLVPIILHEQPDQGRTVIEKFEKHADVSFAVAIFSADDLGASRSEISDKKPLEQSLHPRARQNVVFEFGYFVGALGRKNVVAIVESGVETMSDYSGVLYIPFDAEDGWRLKLVKELKAAGLDVDANAAFSV